MRALVLTAGLGTRLRPLTYVRAKGAVPLNGEPLARRVLRWLAGQGCHDAVLNLHHHPESIAGIVGDGSDLDLRVRYSWENPVLGSAGGPRHALPLLTNGSAPGAGTFLIVNGDTLTDLKLSDVVAAHKRSEALVTMAVIPNRWPEKYGGVLLGEVSGDGAAVTGFTSPNPAIASYHFIGVQVAEAAAFEHLIDGEPAESVTALYPQLISERRGSVRAFVCDAPFQDIGTPADYLATSLALARTEGSALVSRSASIDSTANLERTAVWDHVTVEAGAHLVECVVCDHVRIPARMHLTRKAVVSAAGRTPRTGETIEGDLLIREF